MAVAVGYDWLYYDLSLAERKMIHQALVEKGIKEVLKKDMSSSLGNWNSINICYSYHIPKQEYYKGIICFLFKFSIYFQTD
mgnify:CR=1 FL=1